MAKYKIYECGCCGAYHENQDLTGCALGEALTLGDCRNDANRYSSADDFAERRGVDVGEVEEIPLPEEDEDEGYLCESCGHIQVVTDITPAACPICGSDTLTGPLNMSMIEELSEGIPGIDEEE